MANSKKRLGRGLGGLISEASVETLENATTSGYREIPIKDVEVSPYQPRREIVPEQVELLAASIRSEGLLQPIVVRTKGKKYELIAGERRLRAFKFLKRRKIPARVMDASDASSATLALIENLQRENLNPIDEALGYASLVRDFDLTQEAVAERVGKSRASVANALRLLSLESELQEFVSKGLLSMGHAKVLLGLENVEQRQSLAQRIIETGMSVREAEQRVRDLKVPPKAKKKAVKTKPAAIRKLEKRMSDYLDACCSVKQGSKKGTLTIEYSGSEDLERILEKLGLD